MSSKIRNVALLLPAFVLATGLASAQSGVTVNQVGTTGAVTQTKLTGATNGNVQSKAPAVDSTGQAKYWDGLASTDYYNVPPYVAAPPNPQIAVGPDDILTIVNRTIARYPNPNANGNPTGVANPYNNPPTEKVWLDVWMGLTILSPQGGAAALCPSGTGSNSVCVIDNPSIRYDQLQGRFVVLFTVTDVQAHRSNFVLITSTTAQFNKCTGSIPTCAASSPLFTPPVIAPIVGGNVTGGVNGANWTLTTIPINLTYVVPPTTLGNGIVSVPNVVNTGGGSVNNFLTSNFCPNGGPSVINSATARTCTNYFPTAARMGMDNDNIILTAPVLDRAFSALNPTAGQATSEESLPTASGQVMGPYAGTRVVTVSKQIVYNARSLNFTTQPPACTGNNPIDCTAVNLADDSATGTLTAIAGCNTLNPQAGPPAPRCSSTFANRNILPTIFWEPDNLRGRALASFDSQVAPVNTNPAGVITPVDYLIGHRITDTYGATITGTSSQIFMQPIFFSCPAFAIYGGPSGVTFCGTQAGGQVADLPLFGSLRGNLNTLAFVDDPATVGQGQSGANMTANDGSATTNKRLFVGDARPAQVMFREGLLYEARSVRLVDTAANALGTSTVLYDIIRTCATGAPLPNCNPTGTPGANAYIVGGGFSNANIAVETEWFNGQSVPDQGGDISGFGFYAPMYEAPADVVSSGPVSPINLLPWFDKLFVGMTTGGTSNVAATFSKNLPSLWDFRPGDDAYDTIQPYLDPYTGTVVTTVPCPGGLTTIGVVTNGGKTITVADPTGLGAGMFVTNITISPAGQPNVTTVTFPTATTISSVVGNVVTLNNAITITGGATTANVQVSFSRTPNNVTVTATQITVGSPIVTVASTTGLAIGGTVTGTTQTTTSALNTIPAPIQPGQVAPTPVIVAGVQTQNGFATLTFPAAPGAILGQAIIGTGIPAGSFVTLINGNVVTINNNATASGTVPVTVAPQISAGTGATNIVVSSLTNIAVGESVTVGNVSVTGAITAGNNTVTLPVGSTTTVVAGEFVSGPGIVPGSVVTADAYNSNSFTISNPASATNAAAALTVGPVSQVVPTGINSTTAFTVAPGVSNIIGPGTAVSGTGIPAGDTVATFNAATGAGTFTAAATATNAAASLTFSLGSSAIPAGTTVVNTSTVNVGGTPVNLVAISNPLAFALATGRTLTFSSAAFFPAGTTILNIVGSTLTLSANALATASNVPITFAISGNTLAPCPMIPWSSRGGASTDPNDGSLWLYGEFAKNRLSSIPGPGEWGTSVANYPLSFPAVDPYNNDNAFFVDVPSTNIFFTWIQIAKNLGIAVASGTGACTTGVGGTPIQQPPAPGTTPTPGTSQLNCATFGPDANVSRAEMAYWVVRSQMDDNQVFQYLCATGGDPVGGNPFCTVGGVTANTFSDTGSITNPFTAGGVTSAQMQRYIEVMARRGYTKGCQSTNDPQSRYCPNDFVKRQEMAVFLIRAKMNNVFPTSLSGVQLSGPYGDNFGAFLPTAYFSDVIKTGDPSSDYYPYIQKMRELRITNGTSGSTFNPTGTLTRKEIATFVVRAFFL